MDKIYWNYFEYRAEWDTTKGDDTAIEQVMRNNAYVVISEFGEVKNKQGETLFILEGKRKELPTPPPTPTLPTAYCIFDIDDAERKLNLSAKEAQLFAQYLKTNAYLYVELSTGIVRSCWTNGELFRIKKKNGKVTI